MLQLVKKHWLVGCIIIAAVCITTTWQALNELLVRPRDYEINQLKTKVNEVRKGTC
jgi:hypothetical protein